MCDLYLIVFIGSWLIFVYHTSNWRYRWIQWNLFNLLDFARAGSLYACHTGQEYFWFWFWFFHLKQKFQAIKTKKVIEASQTTYKSGNCQGTSKWSLFNSKIRELSRILIGCQRKNREKCFSGKYIFPRKIFFSDKFSVGFIFSYVHFHVLKHFPTFSCYEYFVLAWIFVFNV